jgi:hypothetical protein
VLGPDHKIELIELDDNELPDTVNPPTKEAPTEKLKP